MFSPDAELVRMGPGRLAAELLRWCALLGVGVGVSRAASGGLTRFMACLSAVLLLRMAADFFYYNLQYARQRPAGGGSLKQPALAVLLALAYWLLLPAGRFGGTFPLGLPDAALPLALFGLLSALNVILLDRLADVAPAEAPALPGRLAELWGRRNPYGLATALAMFEAAGWLAAGLTCCLKWHTSAATLWGLAGGSGLCALTCAIALLALRGQARQSWPEHHRLDHAPRALLLMALALGLLIDAPLAAHLLPVPEARIYGRLFLAGKFTLLPGIAMAAIVMQTITDPEVRQGERRRAFSLALTFLVLIEAGVVALTMVKPLLVTEVLFGDDPGNCSKHLGFAVLAQALGVIYVMLLRMNLWTKGRQAVIVGPFVVLFLAAAYVLWHRRIADLLAVQIVLFSVATLLLLIWTARMLGAGVTRAYHLESAETSNSIARPPGV